MNLRRDLVFTILLCSSFPVLVGGSAKTQDPLDRALYEKFPEAPKTLDSEPGTTGILLLETAITKGGGFKVASAILERRRDGEFIRASRFEKNLILFYHLQPDSYALRLVKFNQVLGPDYTLILPRERAPVVDVQGGALQYLGVVRAHIRTLVNSSAEVEYNTASELEAWKQFKNSYADSPWIRLVNERIGSAGAGAKPEVKAPPDQSDPRR